MRETAGELVLAAGVILVLGSWAAMCGGLTATEGVGWIGMGIGALVAFVGGALVLRGK